MNENLAHRLFVLEETGSFSRSASRLYVARPALVQQVADLEKELGFPIFKRTHSGVIPTEVGKIYLDGLRKIDSGYEDLLSQCREKSEAAEKTLVIGTLANFESTYLPAVTKAFAEKYPEIRLRFKDVSINNLLSDLEDGSIDITTEYAQAYYNEAYKNIKFLNLENSAYCIALSTGDPLCSKNVITLADLAGRSMKMYKRGVSRYDDQLRDYILESKAGINIIDLENYSSSIFSNCDIEKSVVLLYKDHRNLPYVKILPTDFGFKVPFGFGYRKDAKASVNKFLDTARELFLK